VGGDVTLWGLAVVTGSAARPHAGQISIMTTTATQDTAGRFFIDDQDARLVVPHWIPREIRELVDGRLHLIHPDPLMGMGARDGGLRVDMGTPLEDYGVLVNLADGVFTGEHIPAGDGQQRPALRWRGPAAFRFACAKAGDTNSILVARLMTSAMDGKANWAEWLCGALPGGVDDPRLLPQVDPGVLRRWLEGLDGGVLLGLLEQDMCLKYR
jgi:hypothetical protein